MEQQTNVLHEFHEPVFELATMGQRLMNFLIDVVSFYVLMMVLGFFIGFAAIAFVQDDYGSGSGGLIQLLFLFMYFGTIVLYYTLLEGSKGKTLGKLITKTKAVQIDGSPLGYKKAFLRSICRFVPLEFISIFFSKMMWHDQWTYTIVVKDN
jgi:uncharacterized RDD family membrane protein YckC